MNFYRIRQKSTDSYFNGGTWMPCFGNEGQRYRALTPVVAALNFLERERQYAPPHALEWTTLAPDNLEIVEFTETVVAVIPKKVKK